MKRSDSKSFCCPFPTGPSGRNLKGIAAAEPSVPMARAEPPTCLVPLPSVPAQGLSFSLSLQMATAHLFKPNHPIVPLPRRPAGEQRCMPRASSKQSLSAICLHKPSLPSLWCPCVGMSPKPPGPGAHTLSPAVPLGPSMGLEMCLPAGDLKPPPFCLGIWSSPKHQGWE